MISLSLTIVLSLIIIIGLPIVAGFLLKSKLGISWRVTTFGVLVYLIVQAGVSLIYTGLSNIIQAWNTAGSDQGYLLSQILLSVFLGAILGASGRWIAMKYLKLEDKNTAIALGIGFGGAENIMLVGLPLLMTFISMLSNINIDSQTTSLTPEMIEQLEELWQLEFYLPLATALERLAALIMHITTTYLIFLFFTKKSIIWPVAGFGLEFLINGLIVGLSEAGVHYGWVISLSIIFMLVNLYILNRLKAFYFRREDSQEISTIGADKTGLE